MTTDRLPKDKITYVELDEVINDIKNIVIQKPNYVYPKGGLDCEMCWDFPLGQDFDLDDCGLHTSSDGGCRYFDNSNHSVCLIGTYFESKGWTTPDMFGVDQMWEIEDENVDEVLDKIQASTEFSFGMEVRDFLTQTQSRQDTYNTWKDSFNKSLPFDHKDESVV